VNDFSHVQSWNDTIAEYPQDRCIHQLFEAQVERTPNSVAVVFEEERLTYRELNAKANQLARYLQDLGVGTEALVGLCVDRSWAMVATMLGILKSGGAYVPLDPTYPPDRLAFMLEDAGLSIVVTQEKWGSQLLNLASTTTPNLKLVSLDNDWEEISQQSRENPDSNSRSDNLAYVIYTSGSTGKPKGVQIIHKSVANLLSAMRSAPGLSEKDTLIAIATIAFDMSVPEIYLPLMTGARSIIVSREVARNADVLIEFIDRFNVTFMQGTPLTWQMLLEAGWQGNKQLKILCGAEKWNRDLADRLLEKCAELWNMYGPTEATVWSTIHPVKGGVGSIPIGRPIANTQVYILDGDRQPVPVGEAGELHIGGVGLARGYWNRPELTAEKFVANPFCQDPNARLYKTGDLARYLPDGTIEFVERMDDQVKIRGHRIELGEIEAVLSQHPDVQQAIVMAREDIPNRKCLVAYFVANSPSDRNTARQTAQWQKIWDEAYLQTDEVEDASFHIGGWLDSYTGKDLDPEQVRECVEGTVERILSLQPSRLLEIGCGTGLLLFRIAPQCQHYYATDISGEAIDYLKEQIGSELAALVVLRRAAADELSETLEESFDTAISNSVIQYFPNIDYLVEALETAIALIEPDGQIFLGDVLSLPLLEAFHTSVQLYQAPDSLSAMELRQRIRDRLAREQRLAIAPEFFIALKAHFPKISHVEIQLKRGHYQNELTRFRYDVVLHIGKKASAPPRPPIYLNWRQDNLTVAAVRETLEEASPEMLIVAGVPNSRTRPDLRAIELLASPDGPETVGELRQQASATGIEPEDWWQWQSEVGYRISITGLGKGAEDRYDVVFVRNDANIIPDSGAIGCDRANNAPQPWSSYANQPYIGTTRDLFVPHLRAFLQEKLPDYMMPSAFVVLEEMPLTPNGKVNRKVLPAPSKSRPVLDVDRVAPRTPTEAILAEIWTEVLSLNEVGVLDNFFMLGGDSIQATRLISRVRDAFNIKLSLHRLFELPTIAQLSKEILQADSKNRSLYAFSKPLKQFSAAEFDLENIEIIPLPEESVDEAAASIAESFTRKEPTSVALGITKEEYEVYARMCCQVRHKQLSYIAVEKNSKRVVACSLTQDFARYINSEARQSENLYSHWPKSFLPVCALLDELEDMYASSCGEVNPGEILYLLEAGASADVNGAAVALALEKKVLEDASALKYQRVVTICTQIFSTYLALEELGYHRKYAISYDRFEFEGRRVFSSIAGVHKEAVLVEKYLSCCS